MKVVNSAKLKEIFDAEKELKERNGGAEVDSSRQ